MHDSPSHIAHLAFAYGQLSFRGALKQSPEDFIVTERLTFEPSGEGEHVFLWVKKIGLTTEQVAKLLARHLNLAKHKMSYAGLKDKQAVTYQYFSYPWPIKQSVDLTEFKHDGVDILHHVRHQRKLKRGVIAANHFQLKIQTPSNLDREQLVSRIQTIQQQGVPNYFMAQRFGRDENNIARVSSCFEKEEPIRDRHLKSLLLSTARSFLFNHILSERVIAGTWNRALDGDVLNLDGTRQVISEISSDTTIHERVDSGDLHPTGVLYGEDKSKAGKVLTEVERNVLKRYPIMCNGLEREKVEQARRSLRVIPKDLTYQWSGDTLILDFQLPSGCYATAVVRELLQT